MPGEANNDEILNRRKEAALDEFQIEKRKLNSSQNNEVRASKRIPSLKCLLVIIGLALVYAWIIHNNLSRKFFEDDLVYNLFFTIIQSLVFTFLAVVVFGAEVNQRMDALNWRIDRLENRLNQKN